MAAATSSSVFPYVIGATVVELSRNIRTLAPSLVLRISGKSNGLSIRNERDLPSTKTEGPSCLFIGPIESASKETLEALYRQARDAYYSGKPLIVDDMFDRVELKLRWYGSKYVVKYPRCSLRRQSTYADAEEDPSQVFALAGVWFLFLAFGSSACLVPLIYTIRQAYKDVVDAGFYPGSHSMEFFAMLNAMLFIMLGTIIGYPVASASAGALQGLRKNDLMALKGACPNCGEEVFAFVKSNQFNNSIQKAECHVCECLLEFHTKIEQSISRPDKRLVYGRIYLIRRRGRGRRQGGREGFFV